jgi:formylglycine-generating enzyme required for sulfatase activity
LDKSIDKKVCSACGEPVEPDWKFCPACEASLLRLNCPYCRRSVKENWKRCPECGAFLICRICGGRIPPGQYQCPTCAPTAPKAGFKEAVAGIEMVFVPGGRFMMGDLFGDGLENEQPVHEVLLSDFYIGKYPVTQAQWVLLMGENPSRFPGDSRPVEQVDWERAQEFIGKLSEAHQGKYVFGLPSESQWEYAARSGGKEEKFAGGDDPDKTAWHEGNSGGMTHPIGQKVPNGLGLYDMSGNIWEWCLDAYLENAYTLHDMKNPVTTDSNPDRVIRGGSWSMDPWSVRCARRFCCRTDFFGAGLGFRVVVFSPTPSSKSL